MKYIKYLKNIKKWKKNQQQPDLVSSFFCTDRFVLGLTEVIYFFFDSMSKNTCFPTSSKASLTLMSVLAEVSK